ncbi:MAG: lasso RiPP family leader peptide-containing protein [Thermoleophilia bacterium]
MDEQRIDGEPTPYERPEVEDLGSLEDVTQGAPQVS